MRFGVRCLARLCWAAAAAIAVCLAPPPAAAETIRVHTEAWSDYTDHDGTGFAWDILRAVYRPVGIEIEPSFVPYARAVRNVVLGAADAWIGSYRDEVQGVLYPKWHYDSDRVEALFLKRHAAAWQGPHSLKDGAVAWIRGYEYGDYLDVPLEATELDSREIAARMLAAGRISFFLDAAYELDFMLANLPEGLDPEQFVRRPVMIRKLYVAFADTPRGRHLRDLWDRRFPQLLESGRIADIYDAWDFDNWPFDRPRGDTSGTEQSGPGAAAEGPQPAH